MPAPWTVPPHQTWWTHREARSGLSGFGDRPVLHPAWRDDAAGACGTMARHGPSAQTDQSMLILITGQRATAG